MEFLPCKKYICIYIIAICIKANQAKLQQKAESIPLVKVTSYWLNSSWNRFHGPIRTRVYACGVRRLYKETIHFVNTIKQMWYVGMNTLTCSLCLPSCLLHILWLRGLGLVQQSLCIFYSALSACCRKQLLPPSTQRLLVSCACFIPGAALHCSMEPLVWAPQNSSLNLWQQWPQFELLSVNDNTSLWIPGSFLPPRISWTLTYPLKTTSSWPDKAWFPHHNAPLSFPPCLTALVNFTLKQFRFVLARHLSYEKWMFEVTMS